MPQKSPSQQDLVTAYDRFVPRQFFTMLGKEDVTQVQLGDHKEQTLTILFSDIRDFTSLSEAMSPQQNFNFINSYLSQMEPVIRENGGLVDKYVGDAIMALFPTDADSGVQASLNMLERLKDYNIGREKAGYRPIRIGIGLNSGLAMVGTVGGNQRMEGTVISDAVNLASRIETMTKHYGVNLLISEHTYYSLKKTENYKIRFIDRLLVKGKNEPQSVYEIFNADPEPIRTAKEESIKLFEEALACYHFKRIKQAQELLSKCLQKNPQDMPAKVYMERCENFLTRGEHMGTGEVETDIAWKPEMSTGVKLIDHQHQELFAYAHELMQAVNHGKAQHEVERVISFLNDYVATHFRDEEEIMQQHNYPFLNEQKEQHARFIKYFKGLKKDITAMKEGKTYLLFRIQLLVVDWLVNHTLKLDGHFGRFLKQQQSVT